MRGCPPLPGVPGGGPVERGELSDELIDELIDELLGGAQTAEQIAGPDGLLGQLTRRLLERALQAELSDHLGYAPGQAPPGAAGNARNGQPAKTLITDQGPVRVRSPRDRKGTFDAKIVQKRQTRWVGFDDKVIALYARGLTVREIQGHLAEIYGTEVSPALISKITDAVLQDAVRLDGDLYESTLIALEHLYPSLAPEGFLIVDDYGALPACKAAVERFREDHGITEPLETIDWTGVAWRKR